MNKVIALLLTLTLAIGVFVGCQGEKPTEITSNDTKAEEKDTAKEEPKEEKEAITLRYMWWGGDSRHEATIEAVKKYEELNPNINIKPEYMGYSGYYEKLVTQLAGGTAADIMQVNVPWLIDIMKGGDLLVDLYNQDVVDLQHYDDKFLSEFCEYDGQLVGVPNGLNAMCMIANKNFFEELGIDYDKKWTWDELLTIGEQINQENPDKHLLNQEVNQMFQFVVKAYIYELTGNELILDDKSLGFTEEDLTKTFDYVQQLYTKGVIQPANETILYTANENPTWIDGNIGFQVEWPATLYRYMYDDTDLDIISLPVHEDGKTEAVVMKATMLTSVNNNSEYKQEALQFLNWLMNDQASIGILKDVRGVPASSNAQQLLVESDMLNPLMVKAIDNGLANPFTSESGFTNSSDVKTIFNEAIELLAYNETTPEEAAKEVISRLNEYLN